MRLPQLNLRVDPKNHNLVREIAQRLRERDGDQFADSLKAFLVEDPAQMEAGGLAFRLDELEERVLALQADLITQRIEPLEYKVAALTPAPAGTKRIVRKT